MSIEFVELFINPCSACGLCKKKKKKVERKWLWIVQKKKYNRYVSLIDRFASWSCP
jgi:hypothetical protein